VNVRPAKDKTVSSCSIIIPTVVILWKTELTSNLNAHWIRGGGFVVRNWNSKGRPNQKNG